MVTHTSGSDLLERCSVKDAALTACPGLTGLPTDNKLLEQLPYVTRTSSAFVVSRMLSAIKATGHPASILAFPGQPSLFVASNRVGAVWLLRELIPDDGKEPLRDKMWTELASLAWAADMGERAPARGIGAEEGEGEEGSEEVVKEECGEEGGEEEGGGSEEEVGSGKDTNDDYDDNDTGAGADKEATEERTAKGGLNTQERDEYWALVEQGTSRQRAAKMTVVQTVGSSQVTVAERQRERKRGAEKAQDGQQKRQRQRQKEQMRGHNNPRNGALVFNSSDASSQQRPELIPPPTQAADPKEFEAWERLNRRPKHIQELIFRIKQALEGGGTIVWRERRARARRCGRPTKSETGFKIMSYSGAERWLTRAESIGKNMTLEEVMAVILLQRYQFTSNGTNVGVQQQQQQQQTVNPGDMPSPQKNEQDPGSAPLQNNKEQEQGQLVSPIRASIDKLLVAARGIKSSCQQITLATIQNRLWKACYGLMHEETTAAIVRERLKLSEKRPAGAPGHARNEAWKVIRKELANEPEKLRLLNSISVTQAQRWQRFFERLGYGVVFMIDDISLPNSFIEKDLTNDELDQFLGLVIGINPWAIEMGKVIWKEVDGPAALRNRDFSFSNVDAEVIRRVCMLAGAATTVDASSKGTVPGEVQDLDGGEGIASTE